MVLDKVALISLITAFPSPLSLTTQQSTSTQCVVTQPNRHSAPERSEAMPPRTAQLWHGNSSLGTALWPEGKVVFKPGGPGTVLADGALRMKFLWLKTPGMSMTISGHRVDDPSVVLRAEVSHEFDNQGIQPSYLIFPTIGCWHVTASAGRESLSFITAVVKS
jgi:hypothetical protein